MGTLGSGNVFADLGLPNPEEMLVKSKLASALADAIEQQRMTYAEAGKIMGLPEAKVADLCNGRTRSYSVSRLEAFMERMAPAAAASSRTP
jgi:predicted XRE-type DNA-binding protein